MTLTHIMVFAGLSLPFMRLVPVRWRAWGLLIGSILAIGWLQYDDSFIGLEFVLPAATVALTVLVWWVVQPPTTNEAQFYHNKITLAAISTTLFVLWLAISIEQNHIALTTMLTGLVLVGVSATSLWQVLPTKTEQPDAYQRVSLLLIAGIIALLVLIKVPTLAKFLGELLDTAPLAWLGFSYMAFRLMGILFDHRAGRLPKEGFPLRDMAVYVLFFPAFTAGPIDRAQRFIPELEKAHSLDATRLVDGSTRIVVGVFKKFVVADSLALVSMNPTLIDRTNTTWGLWLLLYLYAFQIFFDFSGYSDVAIGLGKLYGVTLPENFDRPYLQQNIQQFWQRWHITLSTWFRLYFFTPVSRMFIRSAFKFNQYFIIFLVQLSTMILIGLWHGVTANFILWGVWHGVGLFAHKFYSDKTKAWYIRVSQRPSIKRVIYLGGVITTFHYVALGWVFFALPEPTDSFEMLRRLFGGA